MGKVLASFLVLIIWLLIAAACSPAPVPLSLSQDSLSKAARPAGIERWEVEWQRAQEAGKKEGTVVIYTTANSDVRSSLTQAFKKRYRIDLEFITGKGVELAEKLKRERRAGINNGDIYMAGPTTQFATLKPDGIIDPMESSLILPEVKDAKVWYGGKLPFLDSENYILGFRASIFRPITINTQLVKPDEINSYRDLLNSRWKGKIAMADPSIPGAAQSFFTAVGEYLVGYDYLRELARQEPFVSRDERLITEWVAKGRYSVMKIGTWQEINALL